MVEPDRPADHPLPKRRSGGLLALLQKLLVPGPWRWVLKQEPAPQKFRPGQHMHGLEEHDLEEHEAPPRQASEPEPAADLDDRLLR